MEKFIENAVQGIPYKKETMKYGADKACVVFDVHRHVMFIFMCFVSDQILQKVLPESIVVSLVDFFLEFPWTFHLKQTAAQQL